MGSRKASLSATDLATHHHLNCDLYLWNIYNGDTSSGNSPNGALQLETYKAQLHRGEEWEATLLSWLDKSNLLLRVPPLPMEADILMENILADDREHFFVAGLKFWPPQDNLSLRFEAVGAQPVRFGLGKPDLVEIVRKGDKATWKVIDAKASKSVKTSHHAQIYFYTLCLGYILNHRFFESTNSAGVWLPPSEGFDTADPDLGNIKTIDTTLLSASLDRFLFQRLPLILFQDRKRVQWHLNPVCRTCKFAPDCKTKTVEAGHLGNIPNLSVEEARILKDLLQLGKGHLVQKSPPLTDIEELHTLVSNPEILRRIAAQGSSTVKKSRQILAVPRPKGPASSVVSPVIQAARSKSIQVIPRLNYTCPSAEDITIVISLVIDPSTPYQGIKSFCITAHTSKDLGLTRICIGSGREFVGRLANIIRMVMGLQTNEKYKHLSTQFYVWSNNDRNILQAHIIHAALSSDTDVDDARLCVGALAQGAALLQTAYQPLLLSGALLGFLSKRGRLKKEYVACLARMGLPTTGSVEECRKRVETAIIRLNEEKDDPLKTGRKQRELGQIPRVVVLKREVEKLFALPVPGYWDLPECFSTLSHTPEGVAGGCPSEEELFKTYRHGTNVELQAMLEMRNQVLLSILSDIRARTCPPTGPPLLVNEAKVLSVDFMDLCRNETLRKLFYMQQFEVLTKLAELWSSRIDGCPDAPILEFRTAIPGSKGIEYEFRLVTGILDAPPEREHPFYDKILVREVTPENETNGSIPVEALFDDLAVSGYVFPLTRYTMAKWENQVDAVKNQLAVAEIKDINAVGRDTIATLRIWGTWKTKLEEGARYRISPRFVDFNTTKALSSLFEIDLQYEMNADTEGKTDLAQVPYLQLIEEPHMFGRVPMPERSLKIERDIQRLFRDLSSLGNASAGSLVLKPSQHRAAQRIMTNRLSPIWGPPGTGKTYTICLSLLRLLEVERRQDDPDRKIIFLTAMTHAAIDAMLNKLLFLMTCYRAIDSLPTGWLDDIQVERVLKGSEHAAPSHTHLVRIYAGTLYQLYNFAKNRSLQVDTLVVDEAGQIALGSLSLVMRSLSPEGRLIIAGDSEQLAPILSAQYPQLREQCLFGSVLDHLQAKPSRNESKAHPLENTGSLEDTSSSQGSVVQLTENFRLNPDLGEFISTIYSRQFKPQKVQARQLAVALKQTENMIIEGSRISRTIVEDIRRFLVSLSSVMLRKPQDLLKPPRLQFAPKEVAGTTNDLTHNHHPISLALIHLKTWSSRSNHVAYEMHVHGEAAIAASLVEFIRKCSPNDDIFIATPHRIQREAVKNALNRSRRNSARLEVSGGAKGDPHLEGQVTVDTIERLQGSEAAFVICLFSIPQSYTVDLAFLLERRRLNVAISRAKTLCILVTSNEVLQPSLRILVNEDTARGFAFLKAYEARAWSCVIPVDLDRIHEDM